MSYEYYGLKEQPFGVTPNPRFLYHSFGHLEVLASLIHAIENDSGMSVLTAEPGLGKTTLLYYLLEQYRTSARTALLFQTQCSGVELLRFLNAEWGERVDPDPDPVLLYERIRNIVATDARAGRRVLVVLDEAQNLDVSALETVRLLSNFETSERKSLHIIIAGQPQLADKLRRPELRQLLQRFTIVTRLSPLTAEQTSEYVVRRLQIAGANGRASEIFTDDALLRVWQGSGGVPRDINRICFNAMSAGFALDCRPISRDVIDEVLVDLDMVSSQDGEVQPQADRRCTSGTNDHRKISSTWNIDRWFEQREAYRLARAATIHGAEYGTATVRSRVALDPATTERPPAATNIHGVPQANVVYEPAEQQLSAHTVEDSNIATRANESSQAKGWRTNILAFVGGTILMGAAVTLSWISSTNKPNISTAQASPAPVRDRSHGTVELLDFPRVISEGTRDSFRKTSPAIAPPVLDTLRPRNVGTVRPDWLGRGSEVQRSVAPPETLPSQLPLPPGLVKESDLTQVLTSTPHGRPPALATQQLPPTPTRASGAELLYMMKPAYPAIARQVRREGTVVLRLTIATDGTVSHVSVVSGDKLLAAAAIDAVKRWRYKPAMKDGHPDQDSTEVTIHFFINSREHS